MLQEYEKRLLAKDHEIKVAQANACELQKRLDAASAQLAGTLRMAPAAPAPPQGGPHMLQPAFLQGQHAVQDNEAISSVTAIAHEGMQQCMEGITCGCASSIMAMVSVGQPSFPCCV